MIIFGPIPSRRLGRSIGINNIPPKVCSYSCIYCQVGATNSMSIIRNEFYRPEKIFTEVSEKVDQLQKNGEKIDYLTFVPDGEPTLDVNLGETIGKLRQLGLKIAVITNSSLLWDKEVRDSLAMADWVSVKIDTVDEKIWHKLDRPNRKLELNKILSGINTFASSFTGKLVTETMLVNGLNDKITELINTVEAISKINADKSYILVPTRPTAKKNVAPPSKEYLKTIFQLFSHSIKSVELLADNEGTDFSYISDAESEILSILSVHPMRRDAVEMFLSKAGCEWDLAEKLCRENVLKKIEYSGESFFVKNIIKTN